MYDTLSDFITSIAKLFIDKVIYEEYFQTLCYDTNDLTLVYWSMFIVPFIAVIIFHKFWDPVEKGKRKLAIIFLISFLIIVSITYYELFNNSFIGKEIEAFVEDDQNANPYFFVFPYGIAIGLLSTVLCFAYASFIRFASTNNNNIPRIKLKK